MPRTYEIESAFRAAIKVSPKTGRTICTADFVRELQARNWKFTPREANLWIEHHMDQFRDISTEEGERRTFRLYNPNQVV